MMFVCRSENIQHTEDATQDQCQAPLGGHSHIGKTVEAPKPITVGLQDLFPCSWTMWTQRRHTASVHRGTSKSKQETTLKNPDFAI